MGIESLLGGGAAGGSAAAMGASPWLAVGLGALGAAQGLMGANAQKKAERANMRANAAAIQYSPWTGMNPGMMKSEASNPYGAALGGASQGALSGLMFGQQFKNNQQDYDLKNKYLDIMANQKPNLYEPQG